jgi:hypothetical protein
MDIAIALRFSILTTALSIPFYKRSFPTASNRPILLPLSNSKMQDQKKFPIPQFLFGFC